MKLLLNYPPVNCYLHHAYPLSVAMSHKDFDSWFLSNYIQMEFSHNHNTLNFFTYAICGNSIICPLLDYNILDLEFLYKTYTNIIDFITKSIELGYYVTTYTDEFYIPQRVAYIRKIHFRHEIMIYGFDLNNEEFNVIGYDDKGNYTETLVSFSQFEASFLNSIKKTNDMILFKPKDSESYNPFYEFDIENVKSLLSEYLLSKNSSARFSTIGNRNNSVYGISIYNELIKYYEAILQDNGELCSKKMFDFEDDCDIRHFHILYEHKKAMVLRIEYLIKNNYLDSNNDFKNIFSNLENDAKNGRNSIIKYNISKSKKLISATIDTLQKMYETEKKAIEDLLELL